MCLKCRMSLVQIRSGPAYFMENNFTLIHRKICCGLAMSGVEISKEQKETQVHVCSSCMNTVVQTFTHLQEQITRLKQEKTKLHNEQNELRTEHEEQKLAMTQQIRALEEKLALLKKEL